MSNYIKNTNAIFTTYGLNIMKSIINEEKISDLANGKIFLSSTPTILDETKELSDFSYSYTFPITSVENNTITKTLKIQAVVPNDANNLDVRTIGLTHIDNNKEYLFAYASVSMNKPASSKDNYTLSIDINFNLGVVNFDWNNLSFDTSKIAYATMEDFITRVACVNTDIVSLEHAHTKNTEIIGKNQAQVVYKKCQGIKGDTDNFFNVINYINTEYLLKNTAIQKNITDAFYNTVSTPYSSYRLINVANINSTIEQKNISTFNKGRYYRNNLIYNKINYDSTAYIDVNNKIMTSNTDTLNIINSTIMIQCTLGKDYGYMNILSKQDNNDSIFSIQLQELYPQLSTENNSTLSPSQLVISCSYNNGTLIANTNLEMYQIAKLTKSLHTYILYCTIESVTGTDNLIPRLHLFIDNEEIELEQSTNGEYVNNITSNNTTLYNYTIDNGLYTTYDTYIRKIIGIDRILTTNEIYQLSLLDLNK